MSTWYTKGIYLCIAGYVSAQTLFGPEIIIGQNAQPLSFAKILTVGGVGPDGLTTYVEENINTFSQLIIGGQATASLETETATVAIGASGLRGNIGGIVQSCTYGTDQQATCVNQIGNLPAATVAVPLVPVFILDGGAQGSTPTVTPAPGGGNSASGSNNGNTGSNKSNGGARALPNSRSASTALALLMITGFFIV